MSKSYMVKTTNTDQSNQSRSRKAEKYTMIMCRMTNIVKLSILTKLIYRFNINQITSRHLKQSANQF